MATTYLKLSDGDMMKGFNVISDSHVTYPQIREQTPVNGRSRIGQMFASCTFACPERSRTMPFARSMIPLRSLRDDVVRPFDQRHEHWRAAKLRVVIREIGFRDTPRPRTRPTSVDGHALGFQFIEELSNGRPANGHHDRRQPCA